MGLSWGTGLNALLVDELLVLGGRRWASHSCTRPFARVSLKSRLWLWHRLLGGPASENGRLRQGTGTPKGGNRCRRGLVLTTLLEVPVLIKVDDTATASRD
jgi:hypothetical protein